MKRIYCGCKAAPEELDHIMNRWFDLSDQTGDIGSCVLGAGFSFDYKGDSYFMSVCSPWQGSISWERHIPAVEQMLRDVGCTDIIYKWGRMD